MKKIYIHTLGCPKNIADSEIILYQIKKNGFLISNNPINSDIVLINTCGFINDAKDESLEYIFETVKLKQKGYIDKIIVFGCLSKRYSQILSKKIPEVDHFFGVNDLSKILKNIGVKKAPIDLYNHCLITPSHYAYIKISDGCNHKCSFCAIPSIKGRYKSKKVSTILKEISNLPNSVKEINLVAQDITYYGKDIYKKSSLYKLLKSITNISNGKWIRLLYAYPNNFPYEILDIILDNDNFCKYLDIPIQHVSRSVLKSMKRGGDRKSIEKLFNNIRKKIPNIALRTSIIVGYPNETKKDFYELVDFLKEQKIDRVGVFTYSHEEGTNAYILKDSISSKLKEKRKEIIMEIQQEISYNLNSKKVGKTFNVLIGDKDDKYYYGRTEYDAPEIDNLVLIQNEKNTSLKIGQFAKVYVTDYSDYDLYGKIII